MHVNFHPVHTKRETSSNIETRLGIRLTLSSGTVILFRRFTKQTGTDAKSIMGICHCNFVSNSYMSPITTAQKQNYIQ